MKFALKPGGSDVTLEIFVQDSSQTDGSGLTGLVYNSSGLSCWYARPRSAAAQLALVTQTVTGAHADGGFVEVDATNMPGWYRLDLSDAITAAGVSSVGIMLKGAANMVPVPIEIQLQAVPAVLSNEPMGGASTEITLKKLVLDNTDGAAGVSIKGGPAILLDGTPYVACGLEILAAEDGIRIAAGERAISLGSDEMEAVYITTAAAGFPAVKLNGGNTGCHALELCPGPGGSAIYQNTAAYAGPLLPGAAPGGAGGLATVDANNYVAGVLAKVTPIDVDGVTFATGFRGLMAAMFGTSDLPNANTVRYYAQDGVTLVLTIGMGATRGLRSSCILVGV